MYDCTTLADFYKSVGALLLNGTIVNPRDMETKELMDVSFCLRNPRARLIYNPNRRFSIMYALVESLLLIQRTNQLKYFSYFNKRMEQFSDDGATLNGAYGMRVKETLINIIDKLRKEPDTRQAIIPIAKASDFIKETKDVPCTQYLHFMIRNDKLDLLVRMRSSDIIWGIPYDVFMFTMLQEVVANTLEIEVGTYYHTSDSLHVYKEYYGTLNHIVNDKETESISFENDNQLFDWWNIGLDYMAMVDNDEVHFFPYNEYLSLLCNEYNYRHNLKDRAMIPEWAESFTQRWKVVK